MRLRDELLVLNERIKLVANTLNAIALGVIGVAILRPLADTIYNAELSQLWWGLAGLAIHALSHYILGYLRKEPAR
jgi:hypothetical protein